MIPLFHDLTDETVLIVGDGTVGARKARRFAGEADVVVIGPSLSAADYGGAATIRAAPTAEDVADWVDRTAPALVVAATDDPAVNAAAETAARERGVLVNRTDRSGSRAAGSVVVPATVTDGPVTAAVATDGKSPALAGAIRDRLAAELDGVGELAEATAAVRADLKRRGIAPERRREAVRAAVRSPRVWKDLGTGGSNVRETVDAVVASELGETE